MKFLRSEIYSGLISLAVGVDWIRVTMNFFGEFLLNELSIIGILFIIDGVMIIVKRFQKKTVFNKVILGVSGSAIILLLVIFISDYVNFNDIWVSLFVAAVDCWNAYCDQYENVLSSDENSATGNAKIVAAAGAIGAVASELIKQEKMKKRRKHIVPEDEEDVEELSEEKCDEYEEDDNDCDDDNMD
ncbi:MAG: hypothetical protein Q4E42_00425 [Phascolarctobacterium sp.]|nr:hypothetical protein [Phascolarctobacterium sp.]